MTMNLDYRGAVVANGRTAVDGAQTVLAMQTARRPAVAVKGFPQHDTLVSGRELMKLMASLIAVRFDRPLVPAWTAQVHRDPKDGWWWSGGFAFAPGGSIVTAGGEGHIEVWDLATGKPRPGFTIKEPVHVGDCIAIDREGRIATDGHDSARAGVPLFWTPDGARAGELAHEQGHGGLLQALAWMPDGRLATSCYDGALKVWDPAGGLVRTLCEEGAGLNAIAVSPAGRVLGGAEDGSVRIWNAATGECERTVNHGENVVAVGFGPKGTFFSAGGFRGKVWAADGTLARWTSSKRGYIQGAGAGAGAVAADGTMLVGDRAAGLRVFDTRGKRTQHLRTDAEVCRIVIGPSGALVTATSDGKLTRWTNR